MDDNNHSAAVIHRQFDRNSANRKSQEVVVDFFLSNCCLCICARFGPTYQRAYYYFMDNITSPTPLSHSIKEESKIKLLG